MDERIVALQKAGEENVIRYCETFPNENICGWWYPGSGFDRGLKPDWDNGFESMTSVLAPVFCCFNEKGENCILIACSEIREKVRMRCGIVEETGEIRCEVEIPLDFFESGEYQAKLYISTRKERYEDALKKVVRWWETEKNLQPMTVPVEAGLPMYSTWYSYHQNMKEEALLEECRQAKDLGMDTIIVDDGWQTLDNSRGYAYCGDWEICADKFPDFKEHVKQVHALGMKYMMWVSVPFVGISSKAWKTYQEQLLIYIEHQKAGVLDPRYPAVREFVKSNCIQLVEQYDIDGLKLDFMDEFFERPEEKHIQTPENTQGQNDRDGKDGMDFYSVQDAVDCMLRELAECLQQKKPGFLIEFRQKYIGPNMRRYGNIFRVDDCPGSWLANRVGLIDLKLLSGNTAIHSDMIMWQQQATAQEIAAHLINSIWGTFQISVKLPELTTEAREVLSYWLTFAREHKELLQEGAWRAHEPQQLYPVVESRKGDVWIAAVYENQKGITIPEGIREGWILYAGAEGSLYVESGSSVWAELLDCRGTCKDNWKMQTGVQKMPLDMGMTVHIISDK